MTTPDPTQPAQPEAIQQTVQPTEVGPSDPNSVTTLEGSDDTVAPGPELVAQGAAGDVEGLHVTPAGLGDQVQAQVQPDPNAAPGVTHQVELQDQVGQRDLA